MDADSFVDVGAEVHGCALPGRAHVLPCPRAPLKASIFLGTNTGGETEREDRTGHGLGVERRSHWPWVGGWGFEFEGFGVWVWVWVWGWGQDLGCGVGV